MASILYKRFINFINKNISNQLSTLVNSSGKAIKFLNAIKAL
jgi:hypothetical protein